MLALEQVLEAAVELQVFFTEQKWKFCFIGGVAVQRWGVPRFTQDVDLTLLTGFGGEEAFIKVLLARFAARRPDAHEFALQNRVLLVQTSRSIDIDIALGALPFEESTIQRSSHWNWSGHPLNTCSAEDLVIHKVFAGRGVDWMDVENVLSRQQSKLNFELIRSELKPLLDLKDQLDSLNKFEQLIATVKRRLRTQPG
jgi:hypothetical protein